MLIGICGPMGSGKSLLASALQERGFVHISFADPLKRIAQQLWGFSDYQLFGPSEARNEPHETIRRPDGEPLTARYALQVLGTDVARRIDQGVWVRAAMNKAAKHADVVISDVRYRDELTAIKRAGGIVIRRKSNKPVTDLHPSERDLLDVPDSEFAATLPRFEHKEDLYRHLDTLLALWRQEAAE